MKTLINKWNPQIRITAPEITTEDAPYNNHQYVYWIPAINEMYNPIDWTLLEEESGDLEKFIEKAQRVLYSSNPDDYIKLVKELAELGKKEVANENTCKQKQSADTDNSARDSSWF